MSLGKRLFIGEAAAAPSGGTSDTLDVFGDGSGLALYTLDYDGSDTGGNYDGTPTDVTFGVDGQINWGASFNGSSSKIEFTPDSNFVSDFTISAWINMNQLPVSSYLYQVVAWGDEATGERRSLGIWNGGSGDPKVYFSGYGASANFGGSTSVSANQWYHVCVTRSGSTVKVYLNGNPDGTGTVTLNSYTGTTGRIGASGSAQEFFNGTIDQVRIFDRAISPTEVSTLYGETATVYTPTTDTNNYQDTITAYYKFDSNANDETTNYDGTEYNITYGFGRFGTAAVFNGASSYISLTDIPSSVSADISISAWINTNTLSGDRTIISLRENRLIEISINSGYSAGQRLEFKFYDNANRVINLNENLITVGNWHHVCLTAQAGGNMIAYFDGVAQGSPVAIGNVYVAGQGDTIGAYLSGAGGFFDGKIDQVRIYGLLLDATEVANLYNEKQAYITTNASDPFGDNNEVAFYELENNSNDSTGSNNGTDTSITYTSGSGIIGTYSADFNGSSSYISVPHSSTFNWTNNKTLSVWVKFDVVGSLRGIVAKGSGSAPFGWVLYMSSTGKIQFVQFNSSDTGATLASTFTAVTDVWYHVCVTGDGATNKLYIDGSLNHSDSAVTATNESDALVIGRVYSDTSNYYHSGEIDQLRFFDRTLDGDEVFKLYAEVIN